MHVNATVRAPVLVQVVQWVGRREESSACVLCARLRSQSSPVPVNAIAQLLAGALIELLRAHLSLNASNASEQWAEQTIMPIH